MRVGFFHIFVLDADGKAVEAHVRIMAPIRAIR
jgi:hypothetical protein